LPPPLFFAVLYKNNKYKYILKNIDDDKASIMILGGKVLMIEKHKTAKKRGAKYNSL